MLVSFGQLDIYPDMPVSGKRNLIGEKASIRLSVGTTVGDQ